MGRINFLALAATAAMLLTGGPALAEPGKLTIELNKLEDADAGACRAFFLFRNQTGMTFEGFKMSLAVLDANGIIDRILAIDAAPLPVARTTLKLFDIPETSCSNISEILLHELSSCRPQNADEMDCFPILELTSKSAAALVK